MECAIPERRRDRGIVEAQTRYESVADVQQSLDLSVRDLWIDLWHDVNVLLETKARTATGLKRLI